MILPRSIGYLTLSGELDALARDGLIAALGPLSDSDIAIIDLADVTYCDSTAVNALVTLQKRMRDAGGGEVRIVRPSRAVRRILEICGLDELFSIHDSLAAAGLPSNDESDLVTYVGTYDAGTLVPEVADQTTRANSSALMR